MNIPATARAQVEAERSGHVPHIRTRSTLAILIFFCLAFTWSWAIGISATLAKEDFPVLNAVLMMAAGFGPSLAGLAVVGLFGRGAELYGWAVRCLNWRVGLHWFVLAFAMPPAVMVLALAVHTLLGASPPATLAADKIPLVILNFGLVLLIGGPLGEEFGWRGYATAALAARLDWRAASLIVGVFWGLWHLPLFFMAGTAQSHMPMAIFMLNILAGSVVFGWLFERTQGSVLPALVLHTSLNTWAGVLGIVPTATTGRPYALVTAMLVLIAMALLLGSDRRASRWPWAMTKASPPC